MRLFVAADLPDAARAAVAGVPKQMASALGGSAGQLKWVRAEHSHLTLVFLGDVAEPHAAMVVESIAGDVPLEPFEIVLESAGVFPARGAPRVLWVGVGAGAAALSTLQREIARRVSSLGIPLDE